MITEAMKFFQGLVDQAADPIIQKNPADNSTLMILRDGTQIVLRDKLPPPAGKVFDVDSLNQSLDKWSVDGTTVWINLESTSTPAVIAVMDDEYKEGRITLPLEFTPDWKLLQKLAATDAGVPMSQKDFVLLLKRNFPLLAGREKLLAAVRNVKFSSAVSGQSVIGSGKESLGRNIENSLTGVDGNFEDRYVGDVRILANAGLTASFAIVFDLHVDPENQTFTFRPMVDSMRDAIHFAARNLQDQISSFSGTILFGSP